MLEITQAVMPTDWGPILLGVAAIIAALGVIIVQVLTLLVSRQTLTQAKEVHTIVNSQADKKDEALIRSNEMLATALQVIVDNNKDSTAAALRASQAAISVAGGQAPMAPAVEGDGG